jgi:probable rRNA maturation factor
VLRGRAFACLVTTDAELQRLNRMFRRQDYATDVLSFPVSPETGLPDSYLGDLAISWQRAREQAREFGHPVETEIQVLMLHGALHLAGMDHETDGGRMSRAETRWRRALGLPSGLIERVGA